MQRVDPLYMRQKLGIISEAFAQPEQHARLAATFMVDGKKETRIVHVGVCPQYHPNRGWEWPRMIEYRHPDDNPPKPVRFNVEQRITSADYKTRLYRHIGDGLYEEESLPK